MKLTLKILKGIVDEVVTTVNKSYERAGNAAQHSVQTKRKLSIEINRLKEDILILRKLVETKADKPKKRTSTKKSKTSKK